MALKKLSGKGGVDSRVSRIFEKMILCLSPSFATDKDACQLNSTRNLFHVNPSLCVWHFKRAVKKTVRHFVKADLYQLRTERKFYCPYKTRTSFEVTQALQFPARKCINVHYLSWNGFWRLLKSLKSQLTENGYNEKLQLFWGRLHPTKFSFSRKKMKVES